MIKNIIIIVVVVLLLIALIIWAFSGSKETKNPEVPAIEAPKPEDDKAKTDNKGSGLRGSRNKRNTD